MNYGGYGSDPISGMMGGILAAGAIYIVIWLALAILSVYISYRIIRAGVRDGVIDALKRTGNTSFGGGQVIHGYPPEQEIGPPAAPIYRG